MFGRAVPQATVIPVVIRHYGSGPLNFAVYSPEDSQRDRKPHSVCHPPAGWDQWFATT